MYTRRQDSALLDPLQVDPNAKLPVLVFIHGGTFLTGSSSIKNPQGLLDQDMILVSPQYRLGPLGTPVGYATRRTPARLSSGGWGVGVRWVALPAARRGVFTLPLKRDSLNIKRRQGKKGRVKKITGREKKHPISEQV